MNKEQVPMSAPAHTQEKQPTALSVTKNNLFVTLAEKYI